MNFAIYDWKLKASRIKINKNETEKENKLNKKTNTNKKEDEK